MATRASRMALFSVRAMRVVPRRAASNHGSHAKPAKGDTLWMGGSALLFAPVFYWLLGPNAPGKGHDTHDHHDHSDAGRALYRKPSREPEWSDEDEAADKRRQRAADGEDEEEEEEESSEGSDEESSEEPAEESSDEDESDKSGDDKPRPQQARSNAPVSNRTPRRADPDKLNEAGKFMTNNDSARNPKKFIEEFRKQKEEGNTAGEEVLSGKRKDVFSPGNPRSEEAKAKVSENEEKKRDNADDDDE